jgi:hypothetical protein
MSLGNMDWRVSAAQRKEKKPGNDSENKTTKQNIT